MIIVVNSLQQ